MKNFMIAFEFPNDGKVPIGTKGIEVNITFLHPMHDTHRKRWVCSWWIQD